MRMKRFALYGLAVIGMCIGCTAEKEAAADTTSPAPSAPPMSMGSARAITYADVQDVFNKNCVKCHGKEKPKEGISLVDYASVMKGGEHGPIVVKGKLKDSVLAQVLRGTNGKKQMPFGMAPLSDEDIFKIEEWIKAGANP